MNISGKTVPSFCTAAALALLGLAASTPAQTLYGVDSLGGFGNPLAVEFTGPPAGPCGYPSGPMAGYPSFAAGAVGCPGPIPFAGWPALDGDITVNKMTDTVYVAGMNEIGEYTTAGAQVGGFVVPFNVTGLGMDSAAGRLWVSSPAIYRRVIPGCGAFGVDMGPFPNPMGAALTDIDWDPTTNTVWVCTSTGFVGNFAPGAPVPACSFNVAALGLGLPLTGIAYDSSTPGLFTGNKVVVVTDGLNIARIDVMASCAAGAAVLAAPTFANPINPFAVAGGPLSGLAFAAHGVPFGASAGPQIALVGESAVGTAPVIRMTGAAPGTAALFINFTGPLCMPIGVWPLYVLPTLVIGPIAHVGGTLSVPAPLPAGTPLGVELYMQFGNVFAGGAKEATAGLLMTTSRK